MRNLLSGIDSAITATTRTLAVAIGLVLICLLTYAVIARYLPDARTAFTEELARILLVWLFMLGASLALRRAAHVAFTHLVEGLPDVWGRRLMLLSHAIVLAFFAFLACAAFNFVERSAGQIEPVLGVSALWSTSAVLVGIGLLIYQQFVLIVLILSGAPIQHEVEGIE